MEKRRYGSIGCGFAGCGKPHSSRGYCRTHGNQLRRGEELRPLRSYGGGECSIGGCTEPLRSLGLCTFHYDRKRRHGDPQWGPTPRTPRTPNECKFPECANERWTQDYCGPHRKQLREGKPLRPLNPARKYVIDHHFFDVIDTEEKAYWLGFITADGCVAKGHLLTINLKAADAGHLEKLAVALSSDYPVRPSSSGKPCAGVVRWHANSIPLVHALGALGVTPRKSATAVPWDGPSDLMRHYWRGMVDGDGGMSLRTQRRDTKPNSQWVVYLCGSRACVEAFARWASEICGSRAQPRPTNHSKSCWEWVTGGNRMARLVVRELYGGCTVSLDRKQALADAALAMAAPS